jgi:hypothetical protein
MTDVGPATVRAHSDALVAAREAMTRHAWQEAFELFTTADRGGSAATAAGDPPTTGSRVAPVRGATAPVEVAAITWS